MNSGSAVEVVASGMVSALGLDVSTACAAAEAGLVRSREFTEFSQADVNGFLVPALVHAQPLATLGFQGEARLLRLAQLSFADLARSCGEYWPSPAERVGFYMSLPDAARIFSGSDLVADEGLRQARKEEAAEAQGSQLLPEVLSRKILALLARSKLWSSEPTTSQSNANGHTGIVHAVAAAARDLLGGLIDAAFVGGVDSLLDEESLTWLSATGRLKGAVAPMGLQPGEAAVIMLLRAGDDSRRPKREAFCTIRNAVFAREPNSLLSGQPAVGNALAQVVSDISAVAFSQTSKPLWFLADHNGENYRAHEWGTALAKLHARSPRFSDARLTYPALSFGETMTVSAGISIAMAIHSFSRGRAPAEVALVVSSADDGDRAALSITKPGG